jgi:hypothetical protein
MPVKICTDLEEAEVTGTSETLHAVRVGIIRFISSNEQHIVFSAVNCDPAPYQKSLSSLKVIRGSGPTCVSVESDNLVISGSDESLARFSTWFEFPSNTSGGTHAHYEYFPGDPYISPDSLTLVIGISHAGI